MLSTLSMLTADPSFPTLLGAALCLLAFTLIASVDGLYFHLYRYRLYLRPASFYEHRLHTLNAVLFVPLTALLYCAQPLGLWRVLGLLLFGASVFIEILDVLCEKESRRTLGGLTSIEYLMHFLMSGLRFGSMLPLLCSGSLQQWLPAQTALAARPLWFVLFGACVTAPGLPIAALHLYLARRPPATELPAPARSLDGEPSSLPL